MSHVLCFTKTPGARPFRQKSSMTLILKRINQPDTQNPDDDPYRDRLLKAMDYTCKNILRSDRPNLYVRDHWPHTDGKKGSGRIHEFDGRV
jgi:adenine-specific DNA-methyltransferase